MCFTLIWRTKGVWQNNVCVCFWQLFTYLAVCSRDPALEGVMVDTAGAACFMRAKVGGAEAGEAGGELLSPSQRLVHALSSACRWWRLCRGYSCILCPFSSSLSFLPPLSPLLICLLRATFFFHWCILMVSRIFFIRHFICFSLSHTHTHFFQYFFFQMRECKAMTTGSKPPHTVGRCWPTPSGVGVICFRLLDLHPKKCKLLNYNKWEMYYPIFLYNEKSTE